MDEELPSVLTPNSNPPEDSSDADGASRNGEDPATDRKKYQRGGRKQSTSRWQSLSDRLPPYEDFEAQQEKAERDLLGEDYQDEPEPKKEEKAPRKPFETGIRSFNLKRAEGSGGRPLGLKIGNNGSTSAREPETKSQEEPAKKPEPESKAEEKGKDAPEERKPVSIRLDLNLMIEVFLKAKIQGDVTITFLE